MPVINKIKDNIFRLLNGFKGSKFTINHTDLRLDESLRRWNYDSEKGMLDLMQKKLTMSSGFIDIGANFGLHSIYAAKLVGNDGEVIAVEPLPVNVDHLQNHVRLNKLKNTKIVQAVISNQDASTVEFFFPDEQFIQTGGLRSGSGGDKTLQVKSIRLSELVKNNPARYRMIKIDVEGAEMDVVLSGEKFLREHHPDLLIEIHGFALPGFGYSTEAFLEKLADIGYQHELIPSPESRDDYFQAYFFRS